MRLLLKVFALSLFASALGILNTSPVHACSGSSALTIKGLLKQSDYVVKARAVEVDDVGQNGILRVESYLVGGPGPEYLLFTRTDPIFVQYLLAGRSSGGDCLGFLPELHQNETFYVFLDRQDTGAYGAVRGFVNPYSYQFPSPGTTVEVYLEGGYENGGQVYEDLALPENVLDVTEIEFLSILVEESGEVPVMPNGDEPYPLKAPLQITTATGAEYLLPIDGQAPIEITAEIRERQRQMAPMYSYGFSDAGTCSEEDCAQISPDGLNIAVRKDDTITFTYGYATVSGQNVLFSTPSDAVAVWNQCTLTIYATGYPRLAQEWYKLSEINKRVLSSQDQETCSAQFGGRAVWSPDGRLLTYSDAEGLWFWDVFTIDSDPRLLIPATDNSIPFARHFSPLGRYLAIMQQGRRENLDLISGEFLPDGIVSPDDRLLLKFDTTAEVADLETCSLAPYECQLILHMYLQIFNDQGVRTNLYDLDRISEVQWQDSYHFITRSCAPDEPNLCSVFRWFAGFHGWDRTFIAQGYAFDYDPVNNTLAIAQSHTIHYDIATDTIEILGSGTTVSVDGQVYDYSRWLDGDIVDIEWLSPLFYRN